MNLRAAEVAARAAERARATGDPRGAVRWEQLVKDVREQLEGASSVAFSGVGATVPLTDREREIALLVARGASSKDVAATLFLSTRTIDNHLQRIYSKLGVSTRSELAASFGFGRAD